MPLEQRQSGALDFRNKGDTWQTIHVWLVGEINGLKADLITKPVVVLTDEELSIFSNRIVAAYRGIVFEWVQKRGRG